MRSRQSLILTHPLFAKALHLIQTLNARGYKTVLAGGCVRDSYLGVLPKDLDLATAAPPEVVEQSFPRTLAVGKAFGTIVVVEGGHNFEVTTFRREGPYLDGRHPSQVEFTDMREDALRRDFTVNALFYDPLTDEVLDFVDGCRDLEAGILRTVGKPEARFGEDHLRMLRAPRFVAQLGFELEASALCAIQASAPLLRKVSAERVFAEMRRLLGSPFLRRGLEVLLESGLGTVIWPEAAALEPARLLDFPPWLNWENAFAAVMLLVESGESEVRLRAWKAPRESVRRVLQQIEGCKTLLNPRARRAERARVLGSDVFAECLVLAEGLARDPNACATWIGEFLAISDQAGRLPPPLVTGQDLLETGMSPGETMGRILKSLYDQQLEGKISSKREALERARGG